jgi:hypothetical protein
MKVIPLDEVISTDIVWAFVVMNRAAARFMNRELR